MVKTIFIKALRDIKYHKGAYIACALVMAIGITAFAGLSQMSDSLPQTRDDFYSSCRFGDAFSSVESMPSSMLGRVNAIDGVEKASGRLVSEFRMENEENRSVTVKTVSYDSNDENRLNDIICKSGRLPDPGLREAVLSESFFTANGFHIGDELTLVIGGRECGFEITGTIQSPEYIYVVSEGSIMPDDKAYGIAFVPLDVLSSLMNMTGEYNDISVKLISGKKIEDVQPDIEEALKPYGLKTFVRAKDQASNNMLGIEIKGLQSMVSSIPIMFLIIGVIIMMVIVKRTIEQQRTLIGLMKAIGYTDMQILAHYGVYGAVIGIAAAVIGGLGGSVLAGGMASLYSVYFHMPSLTGTLEPAAIIQLGLLSLIAAILASFLGSRGVLKMQAAESMRPPAPPPGKKILLEGFTPFWNRLKSISQMVLRNIFRNKGRTVLTLFGLTICYSMIAAVFAFWPMVDFLFQREFRDVQRYDLKIGLSTYSKAKAAENAALALPGVVTANSTAELPVTITKDEKRKDTTLIVLEPDNEQYLLYGVDEKPMRLPLEGVVISKRLAEVLGLGIGDELLLDSAWPDVESHTFVSGICIQYFGMNAFMDREYFVKTFGVPAISNSVMLMTSDLHNDREQLSNQLNKARNVSAYADRGQMLDSLLDQYATSMSALYVMALLAVFAGFAILYNASVISLSERIRELASMRVLGFSVRETVGVIVLEQVILLLIGVLIGIPVAGQLMQALATSMASDSFAIPAKIPPVSYILAACSTVFALLVATLFTNKKVQKLDLVEVLKQRD